MSSALHRRKTSREDDDTLTTATGATEPTLTNGVNGELHTHSPRKTVSSNPDVPNGVNDVYATAIPQRQRQRVLSTPSPSSLHPVPPTLYSPVSAAPPSAGPFRTNFGGLPSSGPSRSPSHLRPAFSHARSPSASSFYPPAPSPLSASFPAPSSPNDALPPSPIAHRPAPPPPTTPQDHRRRHSRIHSRNLSIYFPHPGAAPPPASIAEDGAQELEVGDPNAVPETLLASVPLQQGRELSNGFSFGGRSHRENGAVEEQPPTPGSAPAGRPLRRGHHHKHSLSHNFFSFMEPEASAPDTFTQGAPTPTPASASFPSVPPTVIVSPPPPVSAPPPPPFSFASLPALYSFTQFALGSILWVYGQRCGSLTTTGLGYWVVFDAFGVACTAVLPSYLASAPLKSTARPYGNARLETLAVFAQSIYLIFASVYVCKEAVEHLLLSHGEGHHHHPRDESDIGIAFPVALILQSIFSICLTSLAFDNNSRLIDATSNRIPSLSSLLQSLQYAFKPAFARPPSPPPPSSQLGRAASNPYAAVPIGSAASLLGIYFLVDSSQHRIADLLLANTLALLTFSIAYPAALALAKVLLQTAPERGRADGRLEAFLKVMRELERHPQVLHLPPPHIWQLTPSESLRYSSHYDSTPFEDAIPVPSTLVATLELHVPRDMDDAKALELTRWAWERCMGVLGGTGKGVGAEVTVGVVRG
ncbi:hypothetical protein K439DRAFT_1631238 [Ramaria rubella]|nr:hypothetical protein K439DRAFT_1631238 [Ramaria rubella]